MKELVVRARVFGLTPGLALYLECGVLETQPQQSAIVRNTKTSIPQVLYHTFTIYPHSLFLLFTGTYLCVYAMPHQLYPGCRCDAQPPQLWSDNTVTAAEIWGVGITWTPKICRIWPFTVGRAIVLPTFSDLGRA